MGLTFDFSELENALLDLDKAVSQALVDEVLDSSSEVYIKAMEEEVPEDTGELKRSLGEIKRTGNGVKREVHLGSTSKDRKVVERAYYQEYGNSSMAGRKWMKKSFYSSKEKVIEAMEKVIVDKILK